MTSAPIEVLPFISAALGGFGAVLLVVGARAAALRRRTAVRTGGAYADWSTPRRAGACRDWRNPRGSSLSGSPDSSAILRFDSRRYAARRPPKHRRFAIACALIVGGAWVASWAG
jgi:hypothetical protein